MFSIEELKHVDKEYFEVISCTASHVQLKSKNTHHIWDIESQELTDGKVSILVHHKHSETYPYHVQPGFHPKSIKEAQEQIKKHDEWQMKQ